MTGTIVNTACIIVGSMTGAVLKKGIKSKYQDGLFVAIGLCAIALGLKACIANMHNSHYPVLFIGSLAFGTLIGTALNLAERFNNIANRHSKDGRLGEGLSTAILLFCIGTLSILGPVQSALLGDNTYLFTNATLDLFTSAVLASTYGIGIIWAAPVLFCWQGAFYVVAKLSEDAVSNEMMTELQIVGGILIAASGISILGLKDCKTLNMLPSLFIPIIFLIIMSLF